MDFPVYRKYTNGRSIFKIDSKVKFMELKRTGSKWDRFEFEVKIFPDRQLIADMIEMRDGHWIESSENEFLAINGE